MSQFLTGTEEKRPDHLVVVRWTLGWSGYSQRV